MNFLAHLFLSGENEDVMVGNFMADRIKGKEAFLYKQDITKGILLHRFIDSYTDNHEIVKKSKQRLYSKYHKYSPVIVDVFYDHFLAADFDKYSNKFLNEFSKKCYTVLEKNVHIMPERVQYFLPYMIRHDWLNNYAHVEGAGRTLSGLASRAQFKSNMHRAVYDLTKDYNLYKEEFEQFFPELAAYSQKYLAELKL